MAATASRGSAQSAAAACDTTPLPRPGAPGAPVYRLCAVDRAPVPDAANPAPNYPGMLRGMNIVGEVLAQFVVDTTGRANMSTFAVLRSSNDLFAASVKNVLPRWRFTPAARGGRAVPVAIIVFTDYLDPGLLVPSRRVHRVEPTREGVRVTVGWGAEPRDSAASLGAGDDRALRVAAIEAILDYEPPDSGRATCVYSQDGATAGEPDSSLLALVRRLKRGPVAGIRDCPRTYASMILHVDSLGRPESPRPSGAVDPIRIGIRKPEPWNREVAIVRATSYLGTGWTNYHCLVRRRGVSWLASCTRPSGGVS